MYHSFSLSSFLLVDSILSFLGIREKFADESLRRGGEWIIEEIRLGDTSSKLGKFGLNRRAATQVDSTEIPLNYLRREPGEKEKNHGGRSRVCGVFGVRMARSKLIKRPLCNDDAWPFDALIKIERDTALALITLINRRATTTESV